MADTLASLCEEADRPQAAATAAASATTASGGETPVSCRRAVMAALASQLEEVVAGLTARQASTPKLRFADTASRCVLCVFYSILVMNGVSYTCTPRLH